MSKNTRFWLGIGSLFTVLALWVVSSFLTKKILNDFNHPFLLTFLNSISSQFFFIFIWIPDPLDKSFGLVKNKDAKSAIKLMAKIALPLFPLYFFANYLSNVAFSCTSVGIATLISSTCAFFTLIIGSIFNTEAMTKLKFLATLTSFLGVGTIAIDPEEFKSSRLIGNIIALAGAFLYGCYSTYLKKAISDTPSIHMPLLFAFVGFYTLILTWPLLLLLDFLKIEPLFSDIQKPVIYGLTLNIIFGSLIPAYLWNIAFSYTSPLIVALGMSCNIPVTLIVEHFFMNSPLNLVKIVAGTLILIGFAILNVTTYLTEHKEEK